MNHSTRIWECVECEWLGTHEARVERGDDDGCSTCVCPDCGCESFYAMQTKLKPCNICRENVLIQERVFKPNDETVCGKCHSSMAEDDEDEFEPCSDCDGHDACRDFGCRRDFLPLITSS